MGGEKRIEVLRKRRRKKEGRVNASGQKSHQKAAHSSGLENAVTRRKKLWSMGGSE